MTYKRYPQEIEELIKKWEPYENKIKNGVMTDAPQEAIDAFNKFKKWAWVKGQ